MKPSGFRGTHGYEVPVLTTCSDLVSVESRNHVRSYTNRIWEKTRFQLLFLEYDFSCQISAK